MTDAPPKISLKNVKKAFGDKVVLDGVNLDVAVGESVVIIGGSGTGKSVAIKCILGLLTPDEGTIEIDGRDVLDMTPREREKLNMQIGMLFQAAALFDSLPVWENVSFGLLAEKRCGRDEARDIALEKMALVGLKPDIADLSPADLSGGMQKRVGLARAIAIDPSIIFFDEPTTGLDPIMADVINKLIVHVNENVGATALTITHDMASAKKIGDRIAMLYEGKIIWAGPPDDVDQSGNDYLDQFIHGRTTGPIKMAIRA
ncbi:MAG: ATP-binding cassette domain-containing protein [Rhodospirillaceae bacterium]|jgi:phospholipid/cholesterol/gamma-HCH transport system ATP-binding protein|nr:ATP-binding cassette domain-containing protein [Rhodospirillaceae bacterium]MBT5297926.1 ATP-binding cassette domain-containing protein [Rhodospirillaceae bacterium]MBT5513663.1 ATP-binding cassette domain-containing protein [Rhodospirillaceae bacterium]MBT6086795.1 ATP-binding cassette domain-containing protein [Rhodospirillaceae bacterium]MBT6610142.1 ATP-binding cassette domain-containing protein [Rhodospirillaceae bacterium]